MLGKNPNFKEYEEKWYKVWNERKCFSYKRYDSPEKESFCIMMPPPNVTGHLHIGHALTFTIQDAVVRYKRMKGYTVLWLPGTDHAGIATQNVVERELLKEGVKKEDLGRDKFLEKVWEWKDRYHDRIVKQLQKLGASCDWDLERFTLDEEYCKVVKKVFKNWYESGLIYRGKYLVNWCPRCKTALSDEEVEHKEVKGKLYYILYPYERGGVEGVVVATTRPETMLGDVAVAVHPDDERYKDMVGKEVYLPLVWKKIPVVADEFVDPEFGTGAVKITPAHDPNDFEAGKRLGLDPVVVIDETGKMVNVPEEFLGLDRFECRKKVVEVLSEEGLLLREEEHVHSVGHCYRCGTVIEPYLSDQWFVKMKPLAEEALKRLDEEDLPHFVPEKWKKVYRNWLVNTRDWCISRQLWWGHRIPVFKCEKCGLEFASEEELPRCPKCGSSELTQDEDVLDTWFSSALWPFATLGWPDTERYEYKRFFPTSLLVTGFDIIFFWVAKMVFSSLYFTGKVPFSEVYIHGLIRDEKGKKMSKSAGNAVDPLEVIEKQGADSLRFALLNYLAKGQDLKLSRDKLEGGRNFVRKLWNSARFVVLNLTEEELKSLGRELPEEGLCIEDNWILKSLRDLGREVEKEYENYDFLEALRRIYELFWRRYCDWYLEAIKDRIKTDKSAKEVAVFVLRAILKMLHPVIPFVTEELWNVFRAEREKLLIEEEWLDWEKIGGEEDDYNLFEGIIDLVRVLRNLRKIAGLGKSEVVRAAVPNISNFPERVRALLSALAKVEPVERDDFLGVEDTWPYGSVSVKLEVKDRTALEESKARMERELRKMRGELERNQKLLANESFLKKAPQEVVDGVTTKVSDLLRETSWMEEHLKKVDEVLRKMR